MWPNLSLWSLRTTSLYGPVGPLFTISPTDGTRNPSGYLHHSQLAGHYLYSTPISYPLQSIKSSRMASHSIARRLIKLLEGDEYASLLLHSSNASYWRGLVGCMEIGTQCDHILLLLLFILYLLPDIQNLQSIKSLHTASHPIARRSEASGRGRICLTIILQQCKLLA